jgi:hypothetical protein
MSLNQKKDVEPIEKKTQDLVLAKLSCFGDVLDRVTGKLERDDLTDDTAVHAGEPLETDPHMTILTGMPRLPSEECLVRLQEWGGSVQVTPQKVDFFAKRNVQFREGGKHNYDVLYVVLDAGGDLSEMRETLAKDTAAQPEFEFRPHMTVAYLKPGKADSYVKTLEGAVPFAVTELVVREWGKPEDMLTIKLGCKNTHKRHKLSPN